MADDSRRTRNGIRRLGDELIDLAPGIAICVLISALAIAGQYAEEHAFAHPYICLLYTSDAADE